MRARAWLNFNTAPNGAVHLSSRKIVYVIGSLNLGGTERHICRIAPRLKKLGWEPEIFCLTERGEQAAEVEQAGVKVIGPPADIDADQTAVGKFARLVASGIKLFGYLVSRRPQVAHFFLPAAYLIGAPLAAAVRIPVRVMSRRSLNLYQKNYPLLSWFERVMHGRMHMLLANSRAVVDELRQEAPSSTPIELIYNGIEIPDQSPARAESAEPGALTLITVANLIPYKGHADLLRALAQCKGSLPSSWTLLCVGRDDGIGGALNELTRHLSIASHVRFLGSRTDVGALLAAADIGILCSHEEGFSNAILEGMAAGLPMVVTDVGGNAEAVVDGECGFVVPPRNPQALGAAIAALAANRELRGQMGEAARRRAAKEFSIERCVENYAALYGRLLSGEGRGNREPR